ncbi:hypothetical protein BSKO_01776 [Bryopsis sp. KO-2023]|nr:hypothetical protein BSKO_01776 [Bryopsis sp. KO-2023]
MDWTSLLAVALCLSIVTANDPHHPRDDGNNERSVNEVDSEGRLQLVEAVIEKDVDRMEWLLSYGANSSLIEPASGKCAMGVAFEEGDIQVCWLLMRYGGNPDAPDSNGGTARSHAKRNAILAKFMRLYDEDGHMAFEEQPGSWQKAVTEDTGLVYYWNHHSDVSVYHPPPSCAWFRTTTNGHPVFINSVTHQHTFLRPPALSWRRCISPSTHLPFWINHRANVTVYHDPAELPQELLEEEKARTGQYWVNGITGESVWHDPLEEEWRVSYTDEGDQYYFNPKTGQSTWIKPKELSWQEHAYDDGSGKFYWFNEYTHDSMIVKPEPLAWRMVQVDGYSGI